MLKVLAVLFDIVARFLRLREQAQLREQGRQQLEDVLDANVEKAAAAVDTPDPERDKRLRSRFDRGAEIDG